MAASNFYTGGGLDRAAPLRKDTAWIQARRQGTACRVLPVWRSQSFVVAGDTPRAAYLTPPEGATLLDQGLEEGLGHAFLGLAGEVAYFAVDVSARDDPAMDPALARHGEFVDLRQVGSLMGQEDGAILAYARGLMHWHRHHRHCGRCGAPTRIGEAGHLRLCTNDDCAKHHFPRTDPAVIMLVADGDRCLLGRQSRFPEGMYSTLAGFVEPGESLEEAVAREVFEETGIRAGNVRYHSSQPWPFPASLMLGFHADAQSTDITVNRDEMEDARWVSRAALRADPDGGPVRLPRGDSIARRLIDDWLAAP